MESLSPEQFAAAQRASLDAMSGLASKALEGFEKLLALNLETMKSALAETQEGAQKALAAKDLSELLALQIELLQPVPAKALAYRRQLYEIAMNARTEFDKVAEANYEANKLGMENLMDGAGAYAPASAVAPLAAWQAAFKATSAWYDSLQATVKEGRCCINRI
ncbi:PHA-granule associated protein 4 [Cupriavidus necator]|uniref:PHA-granule associated protein 4 n=2 Tax=Cupriavidus necator TaxID=106590 RepID=A0A1K0JUZ2_CUPNE|nr:PHA-granule associated protein 4 [Cupriavidus necator]